jgi:hypothetical protein
MVGSDCTAAAGAMLTFAAANAPEVAIRILRTDETEPNETTPHASSPPRAVGMRYDHTVRQGNLPAAIEPANSHHAGRIADG